MLVKQFVAASMSAVLVLCATSAEASLSLFLNDGTTSFTINDNGAGDANPAVGAIGFDNNTIGYILSGFTTLNINSVSNAPGSLVAALLNTTQLDVVAGAAKTLAMTVTDNAFTLPGTGGNSMLVANSIIANATLGSGAASASQTSMLDAGATAAAAVAVTGGLGGLNDSATTSASLVRGTPFQLQTLVNASFSAGANVNFTHTTSAVTPEPVTAAIWTVLMGLGMMMVNKRNRNVA